MCNAPIDLLVNLELFNFVDLSFQIIYLIYINKPDLALNNQKWLICHKNKPNQTNGL